MLRTGAARALRTALLAASVLTSAPVLVQEQSVDARLDRLERLVEGLIARIAGSYFKADNPVRLTINQVTDESWNAFLNLIWTPVGPLDVGVELLYASRTLEDGRSGNLQRVQFSTQYKF